MTTPLPPSRPIGEADVRRAIEEILVVTFATEETAMLDHPCTLRLVESNTLGMCVVAEDIDTGVERLRCMVSVAARKVPSPAAHAPASEVTGKLLREIPPFTKAFSIPRSEWDAMTPGERRGLLSGLATAHAQDAGGHGWTLDDPDRNVDLDDPEPVPAATIADLAKARGESGDWREGTWGPQAIRGAGSRKSGLSYSDTPCGGDIVLAPDGSGERYVVVQAITAANPTSVTVRSVVNSEQEFTFGVDAASPVRFMRAGSGRAIETLGEAFPGMQVLS